MLVNLVKNPNIIANPPPISKRITKGKKEGSIPLLLMFRAVLVYNCTLLIPESKKKHDIHILVIYNIAFLI